MNYHLNMSQNKIFKCYVFKMYISVNKTSMLRRAILMKLQVSSNCDIGLITAISSCEFNGLITAILDGI
eukprot:UN10835